MDPRKPHHVESPHGGTFSKGVLRRDNTNTKEQTAPSRTSRGPQHASLRGAQSNPREGLGGETAHCSTRDPPSEGHVLLRVPQSDARNDAVCHA